MSLARSLEESFPDAVLVGVDYSVRSTGLHSKIFDQIEVKPVWSDIDLSSYAVYVESLLSDEETCWLSGLDVEIDWLASSVGDHPRLLLPTLDAQKAVRKPQIRVAPELGMRVPPWVPAESEPSAIHRLGRHSGWHLWIKGVYHEAYPAFSFDDVMRQVERLQEHWPTEDIFIQAHMPGMERAYTFAAYQGHLLGAVEMEKRWLTAQGKTWAASVNELAPTTRDLLQTLILKLGWTGGGEIEFVRSADNQDWLIDFNPRFPAYIHGVTLCGTNLPGMLVGAALKRKPRSEHHTSRQFVRVIEEIPVRDDLPIPRLLVGAGSQRPIGKHPSHQPQLAKRIARARARRGRRAVSAEVSRPIDAAVDVARRVEATPSRIRDYAPFLSLVTSVAGALDGCARLPIVTPALSIKTDPHAELGAAASQAGWWAEAISLDEVQWALRAGFKPSQVIGNGPAITALARGVTPRIAVAFADSLEALDTLAASDAAETIGLRLRLPSVRSRFGVDLSDYPAFLTATESFKKALPRHPYGLHFHFASDMCGPKRWLELFDEALEWARSITDVVGEGPVMFDVGGGWHHADFVELLLPSLGALQAKVRQTLPSVQRMILEPGKAALARTALVVSRITEIRSLPEESLDVVVDASIADLPMAALYAHPTIMLGQDGFNGWLAAGPSRILGSICMESDVLVRGVSFPRIPSIGDKLVFLDAGGYDASMAWSFGKGTSRDDRPR
jgi:diaminopimelate decarboxylase